MRKLDEINYKILNILKKGRHLDESNTKTYLIEPFLQILNYPIYDFFKIEKEYHMKQLDGNHKVDYAILENNEPIMLIEAKAMNENLLKHKNQVRKYFNSTQSVKLALLTNGIDYMFFTDSKHINLLDEEPFYTFSFRNNLQSKLSKLLYYPTILKSYKEIISQLNKVNIETYLIQNILGSDTQLLNFLQNETKNNELSKGEIIDSLKKLLSINSNQFKKMKLFSNDVIELEQWANEVEVIQDLNQSESIMEIDLLSDYDYMNSNLVKVIIGNKILTNISYKELLKFILAEISKTNKTDVILTQVSRNLPSNILLKNNKNTNLLKLNSEYGISLNLQNEYTLMIIRELLFILEEDLYTIKMLVKSNLI